MADQRGGDQQGHSGQPEKRRTAVPDLQGDSRSEPGRSRSQDQRTAVAKKVGRNGALEIQGRGRAEDRDGAHSSKAGRRKGGRGSGFGCALGDLFGAGGSFSHAQLTQLQGGQSDEGEDDRDDPEADHDLLLRPANLLEVVVDGRHPEDPPSGQLEGGHLDHDRQGLDDEDAADNGEQHLLTDDNGNGTKRAPQGKGADIAHEELGRVTVEPKKAEAAADESATEDGELSAARDGLDGEVVGNLGVTRGVGQDQEGPGSDHDRADGEPVETVREVDAIARRHDHERRKGHVGDAEMRREILEEGHGEFAVEGRVGVDEHRDADRQHPLPEELGPGREAIAVLLLHLPVVVDEAQDAVAEGHAQHDPNRPVGQVGPQQDRHAPN